MKGSSLANVVEGIDGYPGPKSPGNIANYIGKDFLNILSPLFPLQPMAEDGPEKTGGTPEVDYGTGTPEAETPKEAGGVVLKDREGVIAGDPVEPPTTGPLKLQSNSPATKSSGAAGSSTTQQDAKAFNKAQEFEERKLLGESHGARQAAEGGKGGTTRKKTCPGCQEQFSSNEGRSRCRVCTNKEDVESSRQAAQKKRTRRRRG